MLSKFQNCSLLLHFINGEWWQQKQTNLQNKINRTFDWLGS